MMDWQPWSAFATSEFATRFVVPILTALGTTIVTNGIRVRRERNSALSSDLLDRLKKIKEEASRITDSVHVHLRGKCDARMKDSQIEIHRSIKSLSAVIDEVKPFLKPDEFIRLKEDFYKWSAKQTDSPFPIQNKNAAVKADNPALSERHDAQIAFAQSLHGLQIEYLSEASRVKIRKDRRRT